MFKRRPTTICTCWSVAVWNCTLVSSKSTIWNQITRKCCWDIKCVIGQEMEKMFLVKRQCYLLWCYQHQYIISQGWGPCCSMQKTTCCFIWLLFISSHSAAGRGSLHCYWVLGMEWKGVWTSGYYQYECYLAGGQDIDYCSLLVIYV